jgi:hypothetical protein
MNQKRDQDYHGNTPKYKGCLKVIFKKLERACYKKNDRCPEKIVPVFFC